MIPLIQLKRIAPVFLVTFLLACFGFFDGAQAVQTDPEDWFPGGNTGAGQSAFLNLSVEEGLFNTAHGWLSLNALTTGDFNTAIGAGALLVNNGGNNTATGAAALFGNTIGSGNTANGAAALFSNTTGVDNTATGFQALSANTIGDSNMANGFQALFNNTTGRNNTANGAFALLSNTTGIQNTATGAHALFGNTTGIDNTATGFQALVSNTTGSANTGNGLETLVNNTEGSGNTANGVNALLFNTTGGANTANGLEALLSNTTGMENTVTGFRALWNNTTGEQNTAEGAFALFFNTTGNNDTALGYFSGLNVITAHDVTCIGSGVLGADVSNSTWIGNVYGITTQSANTAPVVVSSDGQLGTVASSERFKKDIATMDKASEVILSLRPVTFHYKTDVRETSQFGLIAEEVAKVDPALVLPDPEGKPYTVRYDAVNAMLLNEFLKEHRMVQEQGAMIARQQKQIEALTTAVQKVSAQLELSKPVPRTVLNDR